jgi:hypothetical protein
VRRGRHGTAPVRHVSTWEAIRLKADYKTP